MQMLKDDIGYNVSPRGWDKHFSEIGSPSSGKLVTDKAAIESVLGPLEKLSASKISNSKVVALEKLLGLEKGALRDGFKIREVKGIVGRGAKTPESGNANFITGGRGTSGGAPELSMNNRISTTDGNGVKTLADLFGWGD